MRRKVTFSESGVLSILDELRHNQTETNLIDCKEDLPLETEGDRAFFLRHVAALANNVEFSMLILGVEDRTWNVVGLPAGSILHDPDRALSRMVQIIGNRLDPKPNLSYRVVTVSNAVVGIITVEGGTRAPYIAAIDDGQYGGPRTRGEPQYIYRGAIYIRNGSNSIIANRQSDITRIIEKAEQYQSNIDLIGDLLRSNGYENPDNTHFGRHDFTNRLNEVIFHTQASYRQELVPAESWVAIVLVPTRSPCKLDPIALKGKLQPDQRIGRGPEWYQLIPHRLMDLLWRPRATPRELSAEGQVLSSVNQNSEPITHFLRIRDTGYIEFTCTYPLLWHTDGNKVFSFIGIIGYLWQISYFARAIYEDASFTDEVTISLNIIGSDKSILGDFANGWRPPTSLLYNLHTGVDCKDRNIQIRKNTDLVSINDDAIEHIMRDIAQEFASYYGQDRPRCFNTTDNRFPFDLYQINVDRS